MVLVKRSSKNQVALPRAILERAGVGAHDVYFAVGYAHGTITLRPVAIEEKLPSETLARFEARVLKQQPGDRTYASTGALLRARRFLQRR